MKFSRCIIKVGALAAALCLCSLTVVAVPPDSAQLAGHKCTDCHECKVPSIRDTCLKASTNLKEIAYRHEFHNLAEAPDSLILGSLTDVNAPVCFDHKAHAGMSEMGSGCATCHHYSPSGEIPPCSKCHPATKSTAAECVPELETVFHRQCRNCHEDWNRDTTCAPCHRTHGKSSTALPENGMELASTDDMPLTLMPVSKVYSTANPDDPYVTFQHVEHIELFQLRCERCHQKEECRDCHGTCKTGTEMEQTKQVRVTCQCCHSMVNHTAGDDGCIKCHDAKPHSPVFHQIVGRAMPDYMGKVNCQSCHEKKF
jgi:hypothetical protein